MLWLLQIVGLIAFIGAVGIAGWNAWLTWRDGRRWTAKTWNTLIAVSALSCLRRLHVQSPLDDGELLMSRLKLDVAVETLRLAQPFRISGYCFETADVVYVTLDDGTHRGRGEAAGVYYMQR